MPFLHSQVVVQEIDANTWLLLEPIKYQGRHQQFTVPAGFETDFASVPKAFTWLIPRYGIYTKAAILHDFLCATKPIGRNDADGIFRRAMRELGVSFLRRWMMWAAVRAGCGLAGASYGELMLWLLVTIPTAAFLIAPTIVVLAWSVVFWLIEAICYVLLKPVSQKQVNPPKNFGIADNK